MRDQRVSTTQLVGLLSVSYCRRSHRRLVLRCRRYAICVLLHRLRRRRHSANEIQMKNLNKNNNKIRIEFILTSQVQVFFVTKVSVSVSITRARVSSRILISVFIFYFELVRTEIERNEFPIEVNEITTVGVYVRQCRRSLFTFGSFGA